MQILNAPSREELDNAHSRGSWLGIGVPSVRNTFLVSRFKAWCWVALLISSIPIHLLFNSTIFETDYRSAQFNLTIATEQFIRGGPYFTPGASLLSSGQQFVGLILAQDESSEEFVSDVMSNLVTRYGTRTEHNATAVQSLSKAAGNGSSWGKLDPKTCWDSYINCGNQKKYRDLVIVTDEPAGWVRNDMWQLSDEASRYWDRYIPAGGPNHLFFHASCSMFNYPLGTCWNSCRSAFGNQNTGPSVNATRLSPDGWYSVEVSSYETAGDGGFLWPESKYPSGGQYSFVDPSIISLTKGTVPLSPGLWNISDTPIEELGVHNQRQSGLQPGAFQLSMKYCLAEPTQRICHVAVSPTLLLSVTVAVVSKTVIALVLTVVISRQKQQPLVTLGDAVASFIEKPDPVTVGFCTFGQNDMKQALRSNELIFPTPRPWHVKYKRLLAAVPRSVWLSSYLLFITSISIAIYYFRKGLLSVSFQNSSFLPNNDNPDIGLGYKIKLTRVNLLANSPQLLLSLCYVVYNNLFTRMQMAREWATLTTAYHPLRVTDPKGEQFATYRLQLPYKYSLPLIAISIALHWLLSNVVYVVVSIGDYYKVDGESGWDSTLPSPSTITLKYSALTLLVSIITLITLIFVPILLGLKRMSDKSLNSGSNSLALSSACHASSVVYNIVDETNGAEPSSEQRERSLGKLAQSKIRWGVIKMPPEWYMEYAGDGPVEHLGFGAEEDMVTSPVSGHYYA